MLIEINDYSVTVRREVGDKTYSKDDSWLMYAIKRELRRLGYDCIKKKAWKDGHLVDDDLYQIRDRKRRWMLYDSHHAARSLAKDFDDKGWVTLAIHRADLGRGLIK